MDKPILISFIIPAYNAAGTLERSVGSVIAAMSCAEKYEIIIVDDGSTDATPSVIGRLCAANGIIRVVRQENQGLGAARNKGMELAEGKYIAFVDADDEIEPCTDKEFRTLRQDYDIVAIPIYKQNTDGRLEVYGRHTQKIQYGKVFEKSRDYLKGRNVIPCVCAYLWRKDFLEENQLKFRVGIYHEDVEFTVLSMISGGKLICDNSMFSYRYIIRNNSITTTRDNEIEKKRISDFSDILTRIKAYYSEHPEIRPYLRAKLLWLQFDLMRIKFLSLFLR